MYNTKGSNILEKPEAIPPFLAYDLANLENNKNINKATTIIDNTDFVIEKSSGLTFVG